MSEPKGIIYYGLESRFPGDTTKGCGLTASEIDNNFYFLRGSDVSALTWEDNRFIITKYDGTTVESDAVAAYIDDSITQILSGITEGIERVECSLSGLTESIVGCYDDLDALEQKVDQIISGGTSDLYGQVSANTYNINVLSGTVHNMEQQINSIEVAISGISINIDERIVQVCTSGTTVEILMEKMLSGLTDEEMESWYLDDPDDIGFGLGSTQATQDDAFSITGNDVP